MKTNENCLTNFSTNPFHSFILQQDSSLAERDAGAVESSSEKDPLLKNRSGPNVGVPLKWQNSRARIMVTKRVLLTLVFTYDCCRLLFFTVIF